MCEKDYGEIWKDREKEKKRILNSIFNLTVYIYPFAWWVRSLLIHRRIHQEYDNRKIFELRRRLGCVCQTPFAPYVSLQKKGGSHLGPLDLIIKKIKWTEFDDGNQIEE